MPLFGYPVFWWEHHRSKETKKLVPSHHGHSPILKRQRHRLPQACAPRHVWWCAVNRRCLPWRGAFFFGFLVYFFGGNSVGTWGERSSHFTHSLPGSMCRVHNWSKNRRPKYVVGHRVTDCGCFTCTVFGSSKLPMGGLDSFGI